MLGVFSEKFTIRSLDCLAIGWTFVILQIKIKIGFRMIEIVDQTGHKHYFCFGGMFDNFFNSFLETELIVIN